MTLFLAGCAGFPPIELRLGAGGGIAPAPHSGMIAADEPQAALAAQNLLLAGGNAADAAVALALSLTVTLPSSAGLGGGGACLVHDAVSGTTEALDFVPRASADHGAARFRAAVPALARGLFALHAKYGARPWPQVVAPAENLARFGHPVSRALARDLAGDGAHLIDDRNALRAFMTPRRQILQAGESFRQIDLATVLGRVRARGPGEFYAGALGRDVEDAIAAAGAVITAQDLRATLPQWIQAVGVDKGTIRLFALPAVLGGDDLMAALEHTDVDQDASDDTVAGATSFVVADAAGGVVACALTMGRPFGLGIMPAGTGFLLAPAPDAPVPGGLTADAPQLAPVIGINHVNNRMVFAVAAAGSRAVTESAAAARALSIGQQTPTHVAKTIGEKKGGAGGTGRRSSLLNMLACKADESALTVCYAEHDPRGAGYALRLGTRG